MARERVPRLFLQRIYSQLISPVAITSGQPHLLLQGICRDSLSHAEKKHDRPPAGLRGRGAEAGYANLFF
jgi:hypothetical protein